jgi:hypothetical protein
MAVSQDAQWLFSYGPACALTFWISFVADQRARLNGEALIAAVGGSLPVQTYTATIHDAWLCTLPAVTPSA